MLFQTPRLMLIQTTSHSSASHNKISPANPHIAINTLTSAEGILCDIPALFFFVDDATGGLPVAVITFVPNIAGFDAVLIVVVTTETEACLVVASIVVGVMMMVVSAVDIGEGGAVLMMVVSMVDAGGWDAAL